jgi:hypothetical protein
MIEGISLKPKVRITDRQALWNYGCRFVYVDVKDNSALLSVKGDCEFQGFKLGGLARLRYFPGAGLGDTQAFEFFDALGHLPTATLPPVLELTRDDGVLPETKSYRELLKDFLNRFYSYSKGRVILKMTRSLAEWLVPDQFLLDYVFNYGLWIHEPLDQPLEAGSFRFYSLRSYAQRPVAGTAAEWVQFPGNATQFATFANKTAPVRFSLSQGTPPQEPETPNLPPVLTDAEKLAKVRGLVGQLVEILK